jgi:hypothetical protein
LPDAEIYAQIFDVRDVELIKAKGVRHPGLAFSLDKRAAREINAFSLPFIINYTA